MGDDANGADADIDDDVFLAIHSSFRSAASARSCRKVGFRVTGDTVVRLLERLFRRLGLMVSPLKRGNDDDDDRDAGGEEVFCAADIVAAVSAEGASSLEANCCC